jgi:hypothetical protein
MITSFSLFVVKPIFGRFFHDVSSRAFLLSLINFLNLCIEENTFLLGKGYTGWRVCQAVLIELDSW